MEKASAGSKFLARTTTPNLEHDSRSSVRGVLMMAISAELSSFIGVPFWWASRTGFSSAVD